MLSDADTVGKCGRLHCVTLYYAASSQVALEYLLKGPTGSGAQVTADVKAKLGDEHVKVC